MWNAIFFETCGLGRACRILVAMLRSPSEFISAFWSFARQIGRFRCTRAAGCSG